jgi:hypothetical protein
VESVVAGGVDVVEGSDGVGTFVFGTVSEFFVIEIEGDFVAELAGLSPLAAMAEAMLKLSLA